MMRYNKSHSFEWLLLTQKWMIFLFGKIKEDITNLYLKLCMEYKKEELKI